MHKAFVVQALQPAFFDAVGNIIEACLTPRHDHVLEGRRYCGHMARMSNLQGDDNGAPTVFPFALRVVDVAAVVTFDETGRQLQSMLSAYMETGVSFPPAWIPFAYHDHLAGSTQVIDRGCLLPEEAQLTWKKAIAPDFPKRAQHWVEQISRRELGYSPIS